MIRCLIASLVLVSGHVFAHQFTPTYPKFESSMAETISQTTMTLFNTRKDIRFYEISVFDGEWKPVEFAAEARVLQVRFLETKQFNVYVRNRDVPRVMYICTTSKIEVQNQTAALIATRICSKVK